MPKLIAQESKTLAVKKSRNGHGIFTKKDCKANTTLFEVTGTLVTGDEDDKMTEEDRANTYRLNQGWYISPKGRLGDMLNHSCSPNAKVVKREGRLYIESFLPIPKGTELLIDYSTIIASDDSWNMRCNCGTRVCRKVIKQFTKLPKTLQRRYSDQKIVPSYITRIG